MGLFLPFLSVFETVPYCFHYFKVFFFLAGSMNPYFSPQNISGYFSTFTLPETIHVRMQNVTVRGGFL